MAKRSKASKQTFEKPEFIPRSPEQRLHYNPKTKSVSPAKYDSVGDLPLSDTFAEFQTLREELDPNTLAEILEAVRAAELPEDPLETFKRNLPDEVCGDLREFALGYHQTELDAQYQHAINSFPFALANTVQIWAMGNNLALVDIAPEGGPELMMVSDNAQDRELIWATGFGIELIMGILGILGVPKLNNTGVSKMLRKILGNPKLSGAFAALVAGLTVNKLVDFITKLYEEGLLGELVSSALTGAGWATIAWCITMIASKFFSGGTLLAIHCGVLAAELGIKIATKPEAGTA